MRSVNSLSKDSVIVCSKAFGSDKKKLVSKYKAGTTNMRVREKEPCTTNDTPDASSGKTRKAEENELATRTAEDKERRNSSTARTMIIERFRSGAIQKKDILKNEYSSKLANIAGLSEAELIEMVDLAATSEGQTISFDKAKINIGPKDVPRSEEYKRVDIGEEGGEKDMSGNSSDEYFEPPPPGNNKRKRPCYDSINTQAKRSPVANPANSPCPQATAIDTVHASHACVDNEGQLQLQNMKELVYGLIYHKCATYTAVDINALTNITVQCRSLTDQVSKITREAEKIRKDISKIDMFCKQVVDHQGAVYKQDKNLDIVMVAFLDTSSEQFRRALTLVPPTLGGRNDGVIKHLTLPDGQSSAVFHTTDDVKLATVKAGDGSERKVELLFGCGITLKASVTWTSESLHPSAHGCRVWRGSVQLHDWDK
ncbi:hypothetical protein BJ508DRAFT_328018 [Ascobolus immersus RN42]|uniref:Uncharacterized protein n=1 Tax=Ascobolus immersus RN42 TaxID=1160509 RepID=A0A3N4I2U4_ASCIM|nr:hypothetical protein BJ508DRAFT_328018 [Ascobolus immersus RN42]